MSEGGIRVLEPVFPGRAEIHGVCGSPLAFGQRLLSPQGEGILGMPWASARGFLPLPSLRVRGLFQGPSVPPLRVRPQRTLAGEGPPQPSFPSRSQGGLFSLSSVLVHICTPSPRPLACPPWRLAGDLPLYLGSIPSSGLTDQPDFPEEERNGGSERVIFCLGSHSQKALQPLPPPLGLFRGAGEEPGAWGTLCTWPQPRSSSVSACQSSGQSQATQHS